MRTADDDLARARRAFEAWRANRRSRTRIPPELWGTAVALLAHHPVTRVARELHLDPAELRKRRPASHPPPVPVDAPAAHFLEVRASGLNFGNDATPSSDPRPPRRAPEPFLRLQIERADGHRLTLAVPSSEWPRIEALYSLFLRA